MKVLGYPDLQSKGIKWTRQHIHRLVKEGRFPPPFKLGDKTNAWTETEIDKYLKDRVAERDTALKVTCAA
jgi:prophage regulatory protein